MVCMRGRYVRIDPRYKNYGQGQVGWLGRIGNPGRVKGRLFRSRPLLATASQPPSSVVAAAAAADSSSSKADATVLDLSPANLVKCSTSTAAAKIQPVKKKNKKKKRPRFGSIIKLLRLGKKKNKNKT